MAAAVEVVDDVDVDGLVVRAQRGDGEAFGQLWRLYQPVVFGYVHRRVRSNAALAEDLAQDVFVRAWRCIGSYERRGTPFAAWLMVIARNRVLDYVKSAWNRLENPSAWAGHDLVDDGRHRSPAYAAELRDRVADVLAVMQTLTELQRRALELRFLQEMSIEETAAALGVTVGAAKAAQWRALTSVRRELVGAVRARRRVRDHLAGRPAPSRGELAVVPCVAAAGRAGVETATGPAETGPVRPPR